MAKKNFGKFVALATISGVIAAGVSYYLKYKSFHDELDEDFHDFEGEDNFDGELPHASEVAERTYVSLNEQKEKAAEAVSKAVTDTVDKAENMADTVKEKVKDIITTLEEDSDISE